MSVDTLLQEIDLLSRNDQVQIMQAVWDRLLDTGWRLPITEVIK